MNEFIFTNFNSFQAYLKKYYNIVLPFYPSKTDWKEMNDILRCHNTFATRSLKEFFLLTNVNHQPCYNF